MHCRYCDKPITEGVNVFSYWSAVRFQAHAACAVEGYRQEAYDCQVLDADCNDCRQFQRGRLVSKGIWSGRCAKTDNEVRAYPNFCSGHACFEHRRAPGPISPRPLEGTPRMLRG